MSELLQIYNEFKSSIGSDLSFVDFKNDLEPNNFRKLLINQVSVSGIICYHKDKFEMFLPIEKNKYMDHLKSLGFEIALTDSLLIFYFK